LVGEISQSNIFQLIEVANRTKSIFVLVKFSLATKQLEKWKQCG